MRLTPNLLSLSRALLLIPIFLAWWAQNYAFFTCLLFAGTCTDLADGWIARKFNWRSLSGEILDPVCDKLFSLGVLWVFALAGVAPWIYFAIVCIRYLAQLACFPLLFVIFPRPFRVKPKLFAKIATFWIDGLLLVLALYVLCQAYNFMQDWLKNLFHWGFILAYSTSACMEAVILITYIPRLIQIIKRSSDVFE